MKYEGKNLLILGGNVGAYEVINYAKENGAKIYFVDNIPFEKSKLKKYADEHYLVSTDDLDGISKIIKDKNIDGIVSGISEFNLLNAIKLSEKHNLNFYCNKEQWYKVSHKENFRELCDTFNVPAPKTYLVSSDFVYNEEIEFPLILKPVDGNTSRGVFICENLEEYKENFPKALKESIKGKVIVEEFVYGNEFTAHYTIVNGKAKLFCIDNRYPVAVNEGNVTTIPVARIYPSVYTKPYIEQVDKYMIDLCESLGIKNGALFIQGMYNEKLNKFWIFEAGLRSAAEYPARLIKNILGLDYYEIITDQSLLGYTDYDISKQDPYLNKKKCGVISFVTKGGVVGRIEGLEKTVEELDTVIDYELRYKEGTETPYGNTLRQLLLRFLIIANSKEELYNTVKYLNENINVYDDHGNDMVIKFDEDRLYNEFKLMEESN